MDIKKTNSFNNQYKTKELSFFDTLFNWLQMQSLEKSPCRAIFFSGITCDTHSRIAERINPGFYVQSGKFSQDPIEQHFSAHRRHCGSNTHPTGVNYSSVN